jgi:hypothetical protein
LKLGRQRLWRASTGMRRAGPFSRPQLTITTWWSSSACSKYHLKIPNRKARK